MLPLSHIALFLISLPLLLISQITGHSFDSSVDSSLSSISPLSSSPSQTGSESKTLPTGYYVFARANSNAVPPKVRKPPYMFLDAACPGTYDQNNLMPKNNLCGDLNKGFVPRSPLIGLHEHPGYPFEILKNKTLQFLSKALPHLKNEIDSIPKVARFMKPSQFFEHHMRRRSKRSMGNENNNMNDNNSNLNSDNSANSRPKTNEFTLEAKMDNLNSTALSQQSRHQCSGNAICHALESLREEGPLSKAFLSNVVSAVGNMALEQYSKQQHASANNVSNKSAPSSKLSTILQLTQLLTSLSGDSTSSSSSQSSSSSSPSSSSPSSSQSSSLSSPSSSSPSSSSSLTSHTGSQPIQYSPLLSIIDYIQSLQSPKSRKSSDDDGLDGPLSGDRPQTPCQSSEEYVSPTYARNYQGVWKYVVQIPDEGYFTQTVQQTSCVKSKCDLLEGACRESPRWVSLLVAEIFYPDVLFPVNQSPDDGFNSNSLANADQSTLTALAAEIAKQQQQQQHSQQQMHKPEHQHQQPIQTQQHLQQPQSHIQPHFHVMNSNHQNLNKHQQRPQNTQQHQPTKLANGQQMPQRHGLSAAQMQAHELMLANMLKRQDNVKMTNSQQHANRRGRYVSSESSQSNDLSSSGSSTSINIATAEKATGESSTGDSAKKHCDGYDKIGCYNIRVYYDWFLVNGSCKCHRTLSSGLNGINETIKRIFIGKWK